MAGIRTSGQKQEPWLVVAYERMFLGFDVLVVLLELCKRVCSAADLPSSCLANIIANDVILHHHC